MTPGQNQIAEDRDYWERPLVGMHVSTSTRKGRELQPRWSVNALLPDASTPCPCIGTPDIDLDQASAVAIE